MRRHFFTSPIVLAKVFLSTLSNLVEGDFGFDFKLEGDVFLEAGHREQFVVHLDDSVVESDEVLRLRHFRLPVRLLVQIRQQRFDDVDVATHDGFAFDEGEVRVKELGVRDLGALVRRLAAFRRRAVVGVGLHLVLQGRQGVFHLVDDFLEDRLLIRRLGAGERSFCLLMSYEGRAREEEKEEGWKEEEETG